MMKVQGQNWGMPVKVRAWNVLIYASISLVPNKLLLSDQSMLSCLLLPQKPSQHTLAPKQRRYKASQVQCHIHTLVEHSNNFDF